MSNPELKMAEMLTNGQKPSQDDLEEALLHVLRERNALQKIAKDMGEWIATLVKAHVAHDVEQLQDTMDAFMAKHVQIAHKSEGRVH
jgi:hypothetical protein